MMRILGSLLFIVRAEKPWSSSLCHSLVRYTNVKLLLCYKLTAELLFILYLMKMENKKIYPLSLP